MVQPSGKSVKHSYATSMDRNPPSRKTLMRLSREIPALAASLPCSNDTTIFVRVHEDRFDFLKFLIVGPKDTPYENGLFEFDVFLPAGYPKVCPKVLFLTTGNGAVRFNPNLYNNGKVCLSLLGTWSGPGWIPGVSTLLQVLLSIQSLILVAEPYFNEPGFEKSRGTKNGDAECESYNRKIRRYTVQHAMIDHLKNPSPWFKGVIEEHFGLKRIEILSQLEKWQSKTDGSFSAVASNLRALLETMPSSSS